MRSARDTLADASDLFAFLQSEGRTVEEALGVCMRHFTTRGAAVERTPLQTILRATCEACDITLDKLLGPSKKRRHSHPRMAAMYLMRSTGMTWEEISEVFGLRESAARYAVDTVCGSDELMGIVASIGRLISERNKPTSTVPAIFPREAVR